MSIYHYILAGIFVAITMLLCLGMAKSARDHKTLLEELKEEVEKLKQNKHHNIYEN